MYNFDHQNNQNVSYNQRNFSHQLNIKIVLKFCNSVFNVSHKNNQNI